MRLHQLGIVASSLMLAACGGSGGGGTPTPTPSSTPVLGATDTAITVAENSTGTLTTITISDEDVNLFVLTLEGADGAQFSITPTGNLSFISPPDFELPTDQGADNVYSVTIVATDTFGGRSILTVTVTVTNVVDFVATRYLDPLFPEITTLGQVSVASASGSGDFGVTLIGPSGDNVSDRPLVLIASGEFFGAATINPAAMAEQFARRGYVAGIIAREAPTSFLADRGALAVETARGTQDVFAAASFFRESALSGNRFGLDGATVLVAGEGAGGLIASLSAVLDSNDRISNSALSGYFSSNGGIFGANRTSGAEQQIQGALSISGGLFDMGLIDNRSGVMFAAHHSGDTQLGCNGGGLAGSCSMVRGFQTRGVTSQILVMPGSQRNYGNNELAEIYQGAANLFYHSVVLTRGENSASGQ